MRSLAEQSVDELGGPDSLLVRQRRDHADLERLLDQLAMTLGAEQDAVLLSLYRLVFPHAFAEESVVWPVVRSTLPDGDALTVRNEREHQEINELVARLERTPASDPERRVLVDRVSALLRQDARDEEDLILPRLQDALDAPALQRLGRQWDAVRRLAPTRAHPVVARRPPGNVAAALPLTVIDRTRDGLDRLARGGVGGPVRAAARHGSRALGVLARGLEHVPPLPWGEDPTTRSGRRK